MSVVITLSDCVVMEILQTIQGRELLKYQNELFYEHRRGKRIPVITWRCKRANQSCQAILRTLNGELIGTTNAIHSHKTSNHEFTSSNTGNEDILNDIIHELLNLIKNKSPILNHIAENLNNPIETNNWAPITTANRIPTSTSKGYIKKSTNAESSESSEKEHSSVENKADINKKKKKHPYTCVKTYSKTTKPIKWTKW